MTPMRAPGFKRGGLCTVKRFFLGCCKSNQAGRSVYLWITSYEATPSNRCFEAVILTKKRDMYKKFSPLAGSRKPVGVAAE
jgi:hypothetical protein